MHRIGPLSQPWGKYYNPDNSLCTVSISPLAISYMNQARLEGTFLVDPALTDQSRHIPAANVSSCPISWLRLRQRSYYSPERSEPNWDCRFAGRYCFGKGSRDSNAQTTPNMFYGGWGPTFPTAICSSSYICCKIGSGKSGPHPP